MNALPPDPPSIEEPIPDFIRRMFAPDLNWLLNNRQVQRPMWLPANDPTTTAVGAYRPWSGEIVVRQNAMPNSTLHELLHAISYESAPFSEDQRAGYPAMRAAALASGTAGLRPGIDPVQLRDDPSHFFTDVAQMYLTRPMDIPPPLRDYFAPLRFGARPQPVKGPF